MILDKEKPTHYTCVTSDGNPDHGIYPYVVLPDSDLVMRYDLWGNYTSSGVPKNIALRDMHPIPDDMEVGSETNKDCSQRTQWFYLKQKDTP